MFRAAKRPKRHCRTTRFELSDGPFGKTAVRKPRIIPARTGHRLWKDYSAGRFLLTIFFTLPPFAKHPSAHGKATATATAEAAAGLKQRPKRHHGLPLHTHDRPPGEPPLHHGQGRIAPPQPAQAAERQSVLRRKTCKCGKKSLTLRQICYNRHI